MLGFNRVSHMFTPSLPYLSFTSYTQVYSNPPLRYFTYILGVILEWEGTQTLPFPTTSSHPSNRLPSPGVPPPLHRSCTARSTAPVTKAGLVAFETSSGLDLRKSQGSTEVPDDMATTGESRVESRRVKRGRVQLEDGETAFSVWALFR